MSPSKKLTGKQARYLRGLGHSLKPIIQVGKSGVSDTLVKQLSSALDQHELVKVKIILPPPVDTKKIAEELAQKVSGFVAQTIGKTILIYRARKKDPEIVLPGE